METSINAKEIYFQIKKKFLSLNLHLTGFFFFLFFDRFFLKTHRMFNSRTIKIQISLQFKFRTQKYLAQS